MNSIVQLQDSNGNNIYPVGYAQGGMKMDLLWTNPSPTSDFATQAVSLDLTDYQFLIIDCVWSTQHTSYSTFFLCKQGETASVLLSNPTNTGVLGTRYVTVSTTGVVISDAKNGTTTSNNVVIPKKIYGIK